MAAFMQSPGIQITEKAIPTNVRGASSTVGGTVGVFKWGPVMEPVLLENEDGILATFGSPDDKTFQSFFTAANFLAYAKAMYVVRAATSNKNATADGTGLLIKNKDHYETSFSAGEGTVGPFAARYPGTLGNSILVSMADAGTYATWDYKSYFSAAPSTSAYAASKGGSNDELHVIVVDNLGYITGTPGTILERYEYVSKASDAKSTSGLQNYYAAAILSKSQYVYWMDHDADGTNWGTQAAGTVFVSLSDVVGGSYDFTYVLSGGVDDNEPTEGELQLGWDLFKDSQTYDISLMPVGSVSDDMFAYVVNNVGETRRDCLVFGSVGVTGSGAYFSPIFGTSTTAVADAIAYKTVDSTYAVLDSGYKYMYDKYNDKFRWIALNADVAGLCAKVDSTEDPWMSPAGMTKGQIKGVVKLAWNPTKAQRDVLYPQAVNPVISLPGQGTVLFGDKTCTNKPSPFDRINVRRLFLVLEKTISTSSKYQLFEINDSVTRAQFIATVEPFLRDVQGRRGIESFKVICDETNNTPSIVASNEFRGTILVKPRYSINFITLNFVAVGPEVSFDIAAGNV